MTFFDKWTNIVHIFGYLASIKTLSAVSAWRSLENLAEILIQSDTSNYTGKNRVKIQRSHRNGLVDKKRVFVG